MDWIESLSNGVILLRLLIQPKASKSSVVGLFGQPARLKIRIAAPPMDGQANEELVKFLSKILNCSKSQIEIRHGNTSKYKDIHLIGVSLEDVKNRLFPVNMITKSLK